MDGIDERDRTPLARAAARGNTAAVLGYIEDGAEVDAHDDCGFTPLRHAARNGHTETVIILAQHGAKVNVNRFCQSPLFLLLVQEKQSWFWRS